MDDIERGVTIGADDVNSTYPDQRCEESDLFMFKAAGAKSW